MPKANITNTFVKRARCPKEKKKIDYFDTTDTGLVLEVRATGTKTFYYRYNENGTTHQKKLSDGKSMNANEARSIIQAIKKDKVYNTPITLQSKLQLEPKHTSITLEEFYDTQFYNYIKTTKKSYKIDNGFFKNHIFPSLGKFPLDSINSAMISKLHIDLVNSKHMKKSTANNLHIYLSHLFNMAMTWNIITTTINPMSKVKRFTVSQTQDRYLTLQEIQTLLGITNNYPHKYIRYIIPMLLLTGARKMELLGARWCDIDITNRLWTIPQTKTNKVRYIPISKQLEKLINAIPKYNDTYIFYSPVSKRHITNIEIHWNRIRKQAKIPDVKIHTLRHTFASNLVNQGVSLYEVQKLLGHSDIKMTQRYAQLSNQSLYDAVSVAGRIMG